MSQPVRYRPDIVRLMNSAMMPEVGTYHCTVIRVNEFRDLVQKAHREDTLKSYIGYQETADMIEKITGVPIPVSREKTELYGGEIILVARLKYRVNPTDKGREKPTLKDFEFYRIFYESHPQKDYEFRRVPNERE